MLNANQIVITFAYFRFKIRRNFIYSKDSIISNMETVSQIYSFTIKWKWREKKKVNANRQYTYWFDSGFIENICVFERW